LDDPYFRPLFAQRGMDWFKDWFGTPYYALLYGHRDETDARAWTDLILSRSALRPGDPLLDMACGRGRHAELFAAAGLRVTGIDISAPSIEEARSRVPDAEFQVHDMRLPFATSAFEAVVCLFTSIGYSHDRQDDLTALRNAHEALRPGGRFVLDLLNGCRVCRELVAHERCNKSGIGFNIHRSMQEGDIVKRIQVEDGGTMKRYEERVHPWEVAEVTELVGRAGFIIDEVTDGPGMAPFDPVDSERIVVWAHRNA
jgi:SAM-dependent methyltransferase